MKRYVGPLLILLVAAGFLWRVFVSGAFPFFGDVLDQFLPWKTFAREELLAGRLPLWNPYHFSGSPFLANMQSAVLYPIDLLLLPFSVPRAFGLSLWIHTALAGMFAYLFARSFGLSRAGSFFGGVAYMLNGFYMIHIFAGNLLTAYAAAWIPLVLLAAKEVGRSVISPNGRGRLLRTLLWGGPVVALQVLCGHPQMTFYTFFFAIVLSLAVVCFGSKEGEQGALARRASKSLVAILLLLLLGTALAGVQVVPTAEYALHSSRSQPLSFEEACQFTFSPDRMIEFLIPEFFGTRYQDPTGTIRATFWSPVWRSLIVDGEWVINWKNWSSVYFGSFAFLLALFGLGGRKEDDGPLHRYRWALLSLTILALLLSLGPHAPVFRLFFFLPGFKHFRAPSKFTPYMILGLCIFAAAGLDRILESVRGAAKKGHFERYWLAGLVLIALLGLVGLLTRNTTPAVRNSEIAGQTIGGWVLTVSLRAFLFAGCGGLAILALRKRILSLTAATVLILCLHTGELVWLGGKYLTLGNAESFERFRERLSAVKESAASVGAFSISPSRVMIDRRVGSAEVWSLADLDNVSGYDPMQVGDYVEYVAKAEGWGSPGFQDSLALSRFGAPEYDWLNVRYVLMSQPPPADESAKVTVLGDLPGLWVGERNPYPRAFWLPHERVSDGPPARLLEVEKDLAYVHEAGYRRIRPGEIEVRLSAPEDGYLFLSEVYFPGWKAEEIVSPGSEKPERELQILKAGGLFRLIPVAAGEHTIRLRYRPLSFVLGCTLSGVAVLCLLGLLVYDRRSATIRRK